MNIMAVVGFKFVIGGQYLNVSILIWAIHLATHIRLTVLITMEIMNLEIVDGQPPKNRYTIEELGNKLMFTDKELKLWRMALHPTTMDGEITNAAILLIQSLRERKITVEDLVKGKPYSQPQTHWGTVKMPFGKWKGEMLQDIDLDYIHWCIAWIDEDDGRSRKFEWLREAMHHYIGG